jgi:AraC-like DNA-binding protein
MESLYVLSFLLSSKGGQAVFVLTSARWILVVTCSRRTVWWLLLGIAALVSLSLFYWPDKVQQLWFYTTGQWLFLLLMAEAARQRAIYYRQKARQGWMLVSLAIMIWLSSALLGAVAEQLPLSLAVWLLEDLGYLIYYIVLSAALCQSSDRSWLKLEHSFVVMLFGYMILLPAMLASADYESFTPSTLFYLCMDLYLLRRAWQLHKSSAWPSQEIRLVLWLLGLILLNDILDALMLWDWLPAYAAHPLASLYFLPLLVSSALLKLMPYSSTASSSASQQGYSFDWVLLVCAPCVVHLLGYLLLEFDPAVRAVRDWYLCGWLICVALLFIKTKDQSTSFASASPSDTTTELDAPIRADLLEKLDQILEARLGQTNLRLADIAEDLHIQPRQLQRKLNDLCGLTPEQYWLNWRLQRAAELLLQGNKVAYVVVVTGFSQQSHFTRRFKDKFGVTPGEYAKSGGWTEIYKKYHRQSRDGARF